MLEMSKMVFVAFMQHCIQSTDFMSEMSKILYSVYSGPLSCQKGRLLCECPVGLAVHHHAVRGCSFVNFLGFVKLQG